MVYSSWGVDELLKLLIKEFGSVGSSSPVVNTMKFLQSILSKDTSLNIVWVTNVFSGTFH